MTKAVRWEGSAISSDVPASRTALRTGSQAPSSVDQRPDRTDGAHIKVATVISFHYASNNELRRHVRDWLVAYNFAKQLKSLRLKAPFESIEELWKSKPDILDLKPHHHTQGLNT